jgi:hypothetical protein
MGSPPRSPPGYQGEQRASDPGADTAAQRVLKEVFPPPPPPLKHPHTHTHAHARVSTRPVLGRKCAPVALACAWSWPLM